MDQTSMFVSLCFEWCLLKFSWEHRPNHPPNFLFSGTILFEIYGVLQEWRSDIDDIYQALYNHHLFPKNAFFPQTPWEEVSGYLQMHLICWQHLADRCKQKGLYLFRLRPKHHGLDHLQMDISRNLLNPAKSMQCFTDESFLGHIKRIGIRCHSVSMMQRLLQRYILFLSLRWRDSRGGWNLPAWTPRQYVWAGKKNWAERIIVMRPCRTRGKGHWTTVVFPRFFF